MIQVGDELLCIDAYEVAGRSWSTIQSLASRPSASAGNATVYNSLPHPFIDATHTHQNSRFSATLREEYLSCFIAGELSEEGGLFPLSLQFLRADTKVTATLFLEGSQPNAAVDPSPQPQQQQQTQRPVLRGFVPQVSIYLNQKCRFDVFLGGIGFTPLAL
jgi:hypothetical protein